MIRLERHLKARPANRAPLFHAEGILERFVTYSEPLLADRSAILKKKKVEFKVELDRIADLYEEAGEKARHASNNLKQYLELEKAKEVNTAQIIEQIEQKLNLFTPKTKLKDFMLEKERFLKRLIGKSGDEYY